MTTTPFAKKSLGQHFLRDTGAIARIVALARIETGDQVMEIGPGPGALTDLLRPMPWSRLWLLEKDDAFAAAHAQKSQEGLDVWHGDALLFPWKALEGGWKILGNLPYNVASPLMWDIVSQVPRLQRAVFMIQKEVAERIRANVNTKAYGALSVWIQSYCRVEKGFALGPGAFTPPPKVDSEVIVLTALPPAMRPRHPEELARLIKICFQQRRKQLHGILRKSLPELYDASMLKELGIAPESRPESLTPADFQRLTGRLFSLNFPQSS